MFLTVSMVMFTTFEHLVDYIYCHVIQRRKEDCSRPQQLGVTCLAGYAAGAVGTILSNPADNIVSSLYNRKAETVWQVFPYRFFFSVQFKLSKLQLVALVYFFCPSGRKGHWACKFVH